MRTARFSITAIGVLIVLFVGVAQAQSPKVFITGPGEIVDNLSGPKKAIFTVDVIFNFTGTTCLPGDANCSKKTFPICVDYHVDPGTAKAGEDFVNVPPGRLSKTVEFSEDGESPLGTIEIPIIQDKVNEGPETFSVVITLPTASGPSACVNEAAIETSTAEVTLIDAPPTQPKPDLKISAIRLLKGCQVELTIANAGQGALPDSAYNATNGVAIQMKRNGVAWGGIRLAGVDPAKKLKTAGASIKHVWFPSASNLKLPVGKQAISVAIDRFNAVAESNENNNTTTSSVFCSR